MKKIFSLLFILVLFHLGHAQNIDTLIEVGGYKLHFNILKGKGVPILFELGNGDDATVWKDLLKSIHDSTGATLITYDRAGLGVSGIDTLTINISNEIKSLGIGLHKLGFSKNIFIVSHSFGSYY